MKKNILVGQSGGPTAVINASLYGVIQEGLSHPDEIGAVYGMINGIEGFLSGHTINLSAELSKEDLELLRLTPAAYLGTCSSTPPPPPWAPAAISFLKIWMLPYTPCYLKNLKP